MAKHARPDSRRVKVNRSYAIAEVVALLGVHPNTVNNWMEEGLASISPRGEVLIVGRVLKAFLNTRSLERKVPSPPGAMFCLKCRFPKRPPPGLIEMLNPGGAPLNLRGMCPDCGALMHRTVSAGRLAEAGFASVTELATDT